MDDNDLYPIGDVARRTGLSVSAIRFYSDAGIISPTGHTQAGYRLYDIQAIARLELVRTLRELDASLDEIRRLLADETTLADLAATHLTLVERQTRRLHARRAVLRTILKQHSTTEQVSLMHKLVSMSDDDRERLLDEFWNEIVDGLEVRPVLVERLRERRPNLPEDPSTEQLEAWIELADLVRDDDFRREVRDFFHVTFSAKLAANPAGPVEVERSKQREAIVQEAREAYQARLTPDSPQAQDIAARFVASLAETAGQDAVELRRRMAAVDYTDMDGARPPRHVTRFAELFTRYNSLVDKINGTVQDKQENVAVMKWLMTAVKENPHPGTGV
ncbi:MerR family transcriptional regulator [Amycolatopsis pigmentata]|uniref:MerR family transcriptional regulator n=1 Tax=Amycolatopsis pigmentata TaxID=450801 RepID=A0ABW5G5B4_9PSEU